MHKVYCKSCVVYSAEDIGMANPHALQVAMAAKQAVEFQ
ncbi:hypothetical protein [Paenibacillus antarcticus]